MRAASEEQLCRLYGVGEGFIIWLSVGIMQYDAVLVRFAIDEARAEKLILSILEYMCLFAKPPDTDLIVLYARASCLLIGALHT